VVEYTAQMQAAYAVWLAEGAKHWPNLRIVFAILAGGGPFQLERLQSRGVPGRDLLHDNVYFDTASYGHRALELCLATFGVGQLLFGSDAPVIDPEPTLDAVRGFGDAVMDALCNRNPTRLLI
jgi:predicted TIM-barrel fold metal-dependent hydrolase